MSNLMEYSLGADPNAPDPYLLPAPKVVGSAFRFTCRRAAGELIYPVEQNPTLLGACGRTLLVLSAVTGACCRS